MYGPNRLGLLPSTQACLELPDGVARPASEQQRMLFDRECIYKPYSPRQQTRTVLPTRRP